MLCLTMYVDGSDSFAGEQILQFGPGRTRITANLPLNISESTEMLQLSLSDPGEVPSRVRFDPAVAIVSSTDGGELRPF